MILNHRVTSCGCNSQSPGNPVPTGPLGADTSSIACGINKQVVWMIMCEHDHGYLPLACLSHVTALPVLLYSIVLPTDPPPLLTPPPPPPSAAPSTTLPTDPSDPPPTDPPLHPHLKVCLGHSNCSKCLSKYYPAYNTVGIVPVCTRCEEGMGVIPRDGGSP